MIPPWRMSINANLLLHGVGGYSNKSNVIVKVNVDNSLGDNIRFGNNNKIQSMLSNYYFLLTKEIKIEKEKVARSSDDMKITTTFLHAMSDKELVEFFLDENGLETTGEMNRFKSLVRYGADFSVELVKAHNLFAESVKPFHRFHPIRNHILIT